MFASLLCPVAGADSDRSSLAAAAVMAHGFGAHVRVLHARPDPTAMLPYLGEGMSPGMIESLIADAESRAEARVATARTVFTAWAEARGLAQRDMPAVAGGASCAWHQEQGAEDAWIARHGRLADLIVLSATQPEPALAATASAEAALFDTGRPVLLAPELPLAVDGIALVAWNGSSQAARAVGAALPLLARARAVHVVTIAEGAQPADPAALVAYLAWHRIAATAQAHGRGEGSVAEAIDRMASTCGAGLLVMGAYTHSRLRELIFGGVTAHVLRACRRPTLLAH